MAIRACVAVEGGHCVCVPPCSTSAQIRKKRLGSACPSPHSWGSKEGSGGGMPHPLRAARGGAFCAMPLLPTPTLLSPLQLGQGPPQRPHWKPPPHKDAPHPLPKVSSSDNPAMPSCWRTKNQTHGPGPPEEQLQYCHSGFQMEKLRPREKCHHMPKVAQMSQDLDRAA